MSVLPLTLLRMTGIHMIFDIQMEDFHQIACLVVGGHMTNVPASLTYESVVMHETRCIALMLVAINLLEVLLGTS